MKLKEQWNKRGWPRVLLALALNAVFLVVFCVIRWLNFL